MHEHSTSHRTFERPLTTELASWQPTYSPTTDYPQFVKTAVFDVDNTLVASREFHRWLWKELGQVMVGRALTAEEMQGFDGLKGLIYTDIAKGLAEIFSKVSGSSVSAEVLVASINRMFGEVGSGCHPSAPAITEVEGARELVEKAAKISPVTVYTGSYLSMIRYMFKEIGMSAKFASIRTVEDMANNERKHLGNGWLASLKGCYASAAVAFEDTPSGVCGALRAGFFRVYVRPSVALADFQQPIMDTFSSYPPESAGRNPNRVVFLESWNRIQFPTK